MAAEQDWATYANQSTLAGTDTILARTAAGAGVEVPGSALVKKDSSGNVAEAVKIDTTSSPGLRLGGGTSGAMGLMVRDGSFSIHAGPNYTLQNVAGTRAAAFQMGLDGEASQWSYNGSSWVESTRASGTAFNCFSSTTASAANVHQASNGSALLRSTSSLRYKIDVETVDPAFNNVLDLRPVWYRSLADADNRAHGFWGLIAEEVAEIDPRLVHYAYQEDQYETVETAPAKDAVIDVDGNEVEPASHAMRELRVKAGEEKRPDGVQYERLAVLLLDVAKRQDARIAEIEARLAAMENAATG